MNRFTDDLVWRRDGEEDEKPRHPMWDDAFRAV
jgi:hypothetical protein